MIRVKELMKDNIGMYVSKTKNQLNEGTGEILDFKDWNHKHPLEFEAYIRDLKLEYSTFKRIKIRNIDDRKKKQIQKSLEKIFLETNKARGK